MLPRIISIRYIFIISFLQIFIFSCKKEETGNNNNPDEICITVKDHSTQQPVTGASVSVSLEEDLTPQTAGWVQYGTTGANGIACIGKGGFNYVAGITVEKPGYEQYCTYFNPASVITAFEVQLLKRNGHIQFHLINQPPVYLADSLQILMNYFGNFCSGTGSINIPDGTITDTIINYPAIEGGNGIAWNLYRNNVLVSDSSFSVSVLQGDTLFVQVDY